RGSEGGGVVMSTVVAASPPFDGDDRDDGDGWDGLGDVAAEAFLASVARHVREVRARRELTRQDLPRRGGSVEERQRSAATQRVWDAQVQEARALAEKYRALAELYQHDGEYEEVTELDSVDTTRAALALRVTGGAAGWQLRDGYQAVHLFPRCLAALEAGDMPSAWFQKMLRSSRALSDESRRKLDIAVASWSVDISRACQMVCVSRTERNGTIMTMTNEKQQHDDGPSGQDLVEQLKASGQLDALFEQIDAGQVELTGDGGFVPALVKAALERGLQAELTSHLGYEKGSGEASKHANSRNGTTPKTVQAEFGPVELEIPRDRAGSFTPRLVPKGQRRLGGLDDMIISLYAGGMTIRDIQHHLASTFGTDLSHETISNITDAVLEEVAAWQSRPLEEFYPVLYLDAVRVKIRENNQVINRAAYIAIGVDLDGIKHMLGIWVQDT